MSNIKPIDTVYNGYKFRSRLEARWAVFFTELNLKYQYEPEGFDLDSGYYLPDFFVPSIDIWFEIKPDILEPNDEATEKISQLAVMTQKKAAVLRGDPMTTVDLSSWASDADRFNDWWVMFPDGSCDGTYLFCVCPWCGKIGFEFQGRGGRVCGYKFHYDSEEEALRVINQTGNYYSTDRIMNGDNQLIYNAALKARQSRF